MDQNIESSWLERKNTNQSNSYAIDTKKKHNDTPLAQINGPNSESNDPPGLSKNKCTWNIPSAHLRPVGLGGGIKKEKHDGIINK